MLISKDSCVVSISNVIIIVNVDIDAIALLTFYWSWMCSWLLHFLSAYSSKAAPFICAVFLVIIAPDRIIFFGGWDYMVHKDGDIRGSCLLMCAFAFIFWIKQFQLWSILESKCRCICYRWIKQLNTYMLQLLSTVPTSFQTSSTTLLIMTIFLLKDNSLGWRPISVTFLKHFKCINHFFPFSEAYQIFLHQGFSLLILQEIF